MEIKITDQINEPSRADIDQLKGSIMLEFGARWCGYCQAAQSIITSSIVNYPHIRHIKIEDGKGRRLGRSYSVKLWPTLIFIKNGFEIKRLVRPIDSDEVANALELIS
ncbi:MAG: thioredoxin family protein [Methylotenera sp.]